MIWYHGSSNVVEKGLNQDWIKTTKIWIWIKSNKIRPSLKVNFRYVDRKIHTLNTNLQRLCYFQHISWVNSIQEVSILVKIDGFQWWHISLLRPRRRLATTYYEVSKATCKKQSHVKSVNWIIIWQKWCKFVFHALCPPFIAYKNKAGLKIIVDKITKNLIGIFIEMS